MRRELTASGDGSVVTRQKTTETVGHEVSHRQTVLIPFWILASVF
jgi:hypothetical protein